MEGGDRKKCKTFEMDLRTATVYESAATPYYRCQPKASFPGGISARGKTLTRALTGCFSEARAEWVSSFRYTYLREHLSGEAVD